MRTSDVDGVQPLLASGFTTHSLEKYIRPGRAHMIVLAFLAATQPVPVTLLDKADAASAAYVQCLYAVSRNANAARLSDGEFERKLADSCLAEERASRELAT